MDKRDEFISIIDDYKIRIKYDKIESYVHSRDLFYMALRINKKRSFLFVSKLLGKHIPVMPQKPLLTGRALGALFAQKRDGLKTNYSEILEQLGEKFNNNSSEILLKKKYSLKKEALILGFAETATGLGHSVFSSFSDNAYYLHTTREKIDTGVEPIIFYEEHSHASEHRIYSYGNQLFKSDCDIVLVDDEISTGNTILNIIRAIHKEYPRKNYYVLTILDWRNEDSITAFEKLEKELEINIIVEQIVKGEFELLNEVTYESIVRINKPKKEEDYQSNTNINYLDINEMKDKTYYFKKEGSETGVEYLKWTGRFALDIENQSNLENVAKNIGENLEKYRIGSKTLCMGTGEFMYIPMLISSHMGKNIMYQSTTRSPIVAIDKEFYGARQSYKYKNPFDPELNNYFYNIKKNQYDDIFIFIEKSVKNGDLKDFIKALECTGIKNINIVTLA